MSYGGFSGFGTGGASTDVGMSSEQNMSVAVPEQGSGAEPAAKTPGKGPTFNNNSGSTPNFEAKRHDTSDLSTSPREGFQRLAELGPRSPKNYGNP
jgi:hypothetical protein